MNPQTSFRIEPATKRDVPVILRLVRALAEYEKLAHEVTATESLLCESLFGARRFAEVAIGYADDEPAGLAVYFHTFSTFVGLAGLYLEDLYVVPAWRGRGLGKQLLAHVARVAVDRGCRRLEWTALNWNEPAKGFYVALGARAMNDWTGFRLTGQPLEQLAALAGAAAV